MLLTYSNCIQHLTDWAGDASRVALAPAARAGHYALVFRWLATTVVAAALCSISACSGTQPVTVATTVKTRSPTTTRPTTTTIDPEARCLADAARAGLVGARVSFVAGDVLDPDYRPEWECTVSTDRGDRFVFESPSGHVTMSTLLSPGDDGS